MMSKLHVILVSSSASYLCCTRDEFLKVTDFEYIRYGRVGIYVCINM